MINTIVWDFNGTVLDDVTYSLNVMNHCLKNRNMKQIDLHEYREAFCFPISKYYQNVGFDFEKESFEHVGDEWMKDYLSNYLSCQIYPSAKEAIQALKKEGKQNILISATRLDILKKQVVEFGISDLFDDVIGIDNIYAHSKMDIAKEWFDSHPSKKEEVIWIGDSIHDYDCATAINVKCYLYSQGHESINKLKMKTNNIIDDQKEIMSIIK